MTLKYVFVEAKSSWKRIFLLQMCSSATPWSKTDQHLGWGVYYKELQDAQGLCTFLAPDLGLPTFYQEVLVPFSDEWYLEIKTEMSLLKR